nr:uncharacterized protein LOC124223672 [Neodiprion pinetum]
MSPQSSEYKIHNPFFLLPPALPLMLHYVLCAWCRHFFEKVFFKKSRKNKLTTKEKHAQVKEKVARIPGGGLRQTLAKTEEAGGKNRAPTRTSVDGGGIGESVLQRQNQAPVTKPSVRDEDTSSQKENLEDFSSNLTVGLLEANMASPKIQKLDEETLKLLGDNASSAAANEVQFHPELASRWKNWIRGGISKENKKELLDKHTRTGNCPLEAQRLNPEVSASLNETSKRRDKHFADSQNTIGSALSAIGTAATLILNEKENEGLDRMQILELLLDAGKLLSEGHHQEAVARRAYILPFLEKKAKAVLENSGGIGFETPTINKKASAASINVGKLEEPVCEIPGQLSGGQLSVEQPADKQQTLSTESREISDKQVVPESASGTDTGSVPEQSTQSSTETIAVRKIAGRLSNFFKIWKNITSDKFVLACVRGYELKFSKPPNQAYIPSEPSFNPEEFLKHKEQINHLLTLGAVERCSYSPGQFISTYFLAPKPNGSDRFILNLKKLNTFIDTEHFKTEDIRSATRLISLGAFMANLDLQDAYFLIPVGKKCRKFLRFSFEGQLYEFTCLPFGLSSAPRVFTKVIKPVLNWLRSRGFLSVAYLDDILCIGDNYKSCLDNVKSTVDIFESLGFIVNNRKSNLTPSTQCKFLGFILNSENLTLELPQEKRDRTRKLIVLFSSKKVCKIRDFAHFIGIITSCCPAIKYGWLYSKNFERAKYLSLLVNEGNYEAQMLLPEWLQEDFAWWKVNITLAVNPVRKFKFQKEIFSDASTTGWGAFCNGNTAHGFWKSSEINLHINCLELIATFMALKCFARDLSNCELLLRIDNTTAISYVNRMGGVQYPGLNKVSKDIWRCMIERSFGVPEIDLFASRSNTKCIKFCAWQRDPEAQAIDAFTLNWSQWRFYAFPPFALILRVPVASSSQDAGFSCRKVIGEAYKRKNVADATIDLLIASLADNTIKQYSGPLKAWIQFCGKFKIDPFTGHENQVLEFLTERYEAGALYGTLNSCRAVISLISNENIGKSPTIGRFFKGVFKTRPCKPKYDRTWDITPVLNKISEMFLLEKLGLQDLTVRLVTLLALVTAQRVQTLASIKLSNIKETRDGFEVKVTDILKTSRPGSSQPLLLLPRFEQQPKLCIASVLERYIKRTKPLRGNCNTLLITSKKPYRAASSQTISRWIRSMLARSGIGEEYSAHSTRHASTSAALKKGIDINIIKSAAGWSKESQVFAKYYNRPIASLKNGFASFLQ